MANEEGDYNLEWYRLAKLENLNRGLSSDKQEEWNDK